MKGLGREQVPDGRGGGEEKRKEKEKKKGGLRGLWLKW
jgi:hypothetical protein